MSHSGTLTGNLHNLFTTFYHPTAKRWKIVIEKGAFPSDWVSLVGVCKASPTVPPPCDYSTFPILTPQYAVHSHPRLHTDVLSPEQIENAVIGLEPRKGEDIFHTEDILKVLEENKDEVSEIRTLLPDHH